MAFPWLVSRFIKTRFITANKNSSQCGVIHPPGWHTRVLFCLFIFVTNYVINDPSGVINAIHWVSSPTKLHPRRTSSTTTTNSNSKPSIKQTRRRRALLWGAIPRRQYLLRRNSFPSKSSNVGRNDILKGRNLTKYQKFQLESVSQSE